MLQSYVLHWYHTYPLCPVMYRLEAMIIQHFYWPSIRKFTQKEVTKCDTFQHTKQSNIKYGKLPDKEAGEIPRNKLCVDLIGNYVIQIKGQKYDLNIKAITTIDPVPVWFKITQYYNKKVISIANLVETTWSTLYPRPMEITYDQGSEFIDHEFRKYLIEE